MPVLLDQVQSVSVDRDDQHDVGAVDNRVGAGRPVRATNGVFSDRQPRIGVHLPAAQGVHVTQCAFPVRQDARSSAPDVFPRRLAVEVHLDEARIAAVAEGRRAASFVQSGRNRSADHTPLIDTERTG